MKFCEKSWNPENCQVNPGSSCIGRKIWLKFPIPICHLIQPHTRSFCMFIVRRDTSKCSLCHEWSHSGRSMKNLRSLMLLCERKLFSHHIEFRTASSLIRTTTENKRKQCAIAAEIPNDNKLNRNLSGKRDIWVVVGCRVECMKKFECAIRTVCFLSL